MAPAASSHFDAAPTRPPAVAGLFYPADADELRRMVSGFIDQGASRAAEAAGEAAPGRPKAIIAPHAGYPFSGPVAGVAYAALHELRPVIQRVVLVGPAHRVAVSGLAVPSAGAFDTPMGPVPVDREAVGRLLELPAVNVHDRAHAPEHGLEVHLPFLMQTLGAPDAERGAGSGFNIVPIVFGDADDEQMTRALARVWGGAETLIVVSSDLSHFYDYDTARQLDRQTADHIMQGEFEPITPRDACGHLAIRGLMQLAHTYRLHPRLLDLRSSGDTAGTRDEVVGYGSFAYC